MENSYTRRYITKHSIR